MLSLKIFLRGYEPYMYGKYGIDIMDKKIAMVERLVINYTENWVVSDVHFPELEKGIEAVFGTRDDEMYKGTMHYIEVVSNGVDIESVALNGDSSSLSNWYTLIQPNQQGRLLRV